MQGSGHQQCRSSWTLGHLSCCLSLGLLLLNVDQILVAKVILFFLQELIDQVLVARLGFLFLNHISIPDSEEVDLVNVSCVDQ